MICLKEYKSIIITLSVIALIAAGIVNYVKDLIGQPIDILIPKEFTYNGAKIALAWTDDNTGENLIIQSDKKEYSGFNMVDVYFSITNISNKDQEADIVIWLEDGKRSVEKVLKIQDTRNNNQTNYKLQITNYKSNPNDKIQNRKDVGGNNNGYAVKDNIESGQTNYYKATIKYPPLSRGEFFIEAFSAQGGYGHLDPWYSSSWTYKRAITLQGSKIATTTTAFPVLATTTLADLKTTTNGGKVGNDNGYDIIFVDSDDSTLLNYEREKYASTTGEIAYWIKTDIASSTDKTIYMYYGNSGASDTATTTGVWDNNYVGVWHMPDSATASGTDSTLFANNGNVKNGASTTASAQIDGAMQFDGVNDYVGCGTNSSLQIGGALTLSGWMKLNSDYTSIQIPIGNANEGASYGYYNLIFGLTDNKYEFTHDNGNTLVTATTPITDNNWHHITVTRAGTTGNWTVKIYIDGNLDKEQTLIFNPNGILTSYTSIGRVGYYTGYYFKGTTDEARVSNTARTAGWITTEFNNQNSVGTFLTIGDEVCMPVPAARSGAGENVKTRIKGGVRFKGGSRF